ncbi:phosphatidylinositol-3,5-bisphosphate 3-phosphatase MTMR14-like [Diadema setosum]|uniref:phosphatidylinositol-3,5-bisphosphate 3-phosphatase MTMR14-like n=1 Tax=Diadema setosum TaxID=31175 RepID=UPI003B3AFFFD
MGESHAHDPMSVSDSSLRQLLDHFSKTPYRARDNSNSSKIEGFERKCLALFGKDYKYSVILNSNGELCGHYPGKLVIMEYMLENDILMEERMESLYDISKLRELMFRSRFARCRERFVMPVILYEGKHICRSATLSGGPEIYGRSGLNYFFSGGESAEPDDDETMTHMSRSTAASNDWPLFDRVRGQDIKLMKMLSVNSVCDLMLENKKVKFGVNVTSSEKVDKEHRYADFCLLSLPYPGCEFFKDFRDNGFNGINLFFDWSQDFVDADLSIPDRVASSTAIDWHMYRSWDLVKITQNYLKLLLYLIKDGDSGLLVHCISGWDRTPLYISLLRLSLWADCKAHASLTAAEILYLTIAYDWLLFGHNLSDRLSKGEDVFFFCFNFLKHITSDEFSLVSRRNQRGSIRNDSESYLEQMVLLDLEESKKYKLGSNSSLSSNISVTSISSTSSPIISSIHDSTSSSAREEGRNGDAHQASNGALKCNGSDRTKSPGYRYDSSKQGLVQPQSATSPVAVPRACRRSSADLAKSTSSACGSWQIVSGTGSVKGYFSARDSPLTINSDVSSGSGSSATSSAPIHESIPEDSLRKQRLDEVRMLFNKIYSAVIGPRYSMEPQSGISSVIGNLATKVGLKGGRGTYV